jgi:hypothetical protein
MTRNYGKSVSEIVQRIMNRRITGREQYVEHRRGGEKKDARLYQKQPALRQRKSQPNA